MKYEFELLQINEKNLKKGQRSLLFRPCPVGGQVDLKDNGYEVVYKSTMEYDGEIDPERWSILGRLFSQFNNNRPEDFTRRSMSVSDIIKIKINGEWEYHYCDDIGFRQVNIEMKESLA